MGCCRKECGASYLIKSCSTTTPIYKSSLWWGLLAVGESILRSGWGPSLWWAARQCCYCTSQARGYDGSNNARQIPPQIPPISGRGAEPTHGEWKRVILEQFPLILLPFTRWKSFFFPRFSYAQCHADLPWNIAQACGVGCPELTQCLSGL